MIRAFFIELVFPLLLFLLLRVLFRDFLAGFRSSASHRSAPQPKPAAPGGELKKDPVCGTYVSTATGITRTVNGKVMYFCSNECREKYLVG
jgi:YHS domain-containing protein